MTKKFVDIVGQRMAYLEAGQGKPILFLHGNPTSSYLWRHVIPDVAEVGRCIAVDLIGMGDSAKLPDPNEKAYHYDVHRRYLWNFIETVLPGEQITLVMHDWGSALGFDWANQHRERVGGMAYMEAIVRPFEGWSEWPEGARQIFQGLRGPEGEAMVLDQNLFVERLLPGSTLSGISETDLAIYRAPYRERGDRWPMLAWSRMVPVGGQPREVDLQVRNYSNWLEEDQHPKLFVNAEPGAILTGSHRAFCRTWHNQEEVTVRGHHFIQEDSGLEIGRAIADWYRRKVQGGDPAAWLRDAADDDVDV